MHKMFKMLKTKILRKNKSTFFAQESQESKVSPGRLLDIQKTFLVDNASGKIKSFCLALVFPDRFCCENFFENIAFLNIDHDSGKHFKKHNVKIKKEFYIQFHSAHDSADFGGEIFLNPDTKAPGYVCVFGLKEALTFSEFFHEESHYLKDAETHLCDMISTLNKYVNLNGVTITEVKADYENAKSASRRLDDFSNQF